MNIINAKHEKKKVPGWQFFAALGISGAGKSAGKALFQTFRTFEEIMDASVEDLLKVEGIGGTTAEAIRDYFDNHSAAVKDLLNFVELEVPKTGKLSGKNFVLSGSFELGKNYWQKKIQDLGGSIGSSVGSKTDYLVAGPGSGSKSEKAKELEVTIIDVEKLEQMLLS
jgi:DNA ligase (NAD+)